MGRGLTYFTLIALLLAAAAVKAQAPDTAWTLMVGGEYSEVASSGIATCDNCVIVTGYTSSFEAWQCDGYFTKINMDGDTVWTKMYGESYYDYVMDIVLTPDSCLTMAGKHSFPSSGIRQCWLLKLDMDGNEVWEKNFVGNYDFETSGLCVTSDTGYAITGYTGVYGNYDVFLFRTDANGDSLWVKSFGGPEDDKGVAVEQTADGGFLIAGVTNSFGAGDADLWVIKTDEYGDTVWTRTFGHEYGEYEPRMIKTGDGNFMILTSTFYDGLVSYKYLMVKIKDNGDTLWTKEVDGEKSPTVGDIIETSDNGFVLTGSANYGYPNGNQFYTVKVDATGDTIWTVTHGGNTHDASKFVYENDAGEIILGGTWGTSSDGDFYIVKLNSSAIDVNENQEDILPTSFDLHQNYPNPFNASTAIEYAVPAKAQVTVTIYNILGREVNTLVDENKAAGNYRIIWDGSDYSGKTVASGIYLYQVKVGVKTGVKKAVLLK